MEGENEETERREQGIENERIELLVLVFNNQSAGQIMHQEEGGGAGAGQREDNADSNHNFFMLRLDEWLVYYLALIR